MNNRNFKKNHAAITSSDSFNFPTVDNSDLVDQMEQLLEDYNDPAKGACWLEWQAASDPQVVFTLCALMGVSKENLKCLINDLKEGQFPKLAKWLQFNNWATTNLSVKKDDAVKWTSLFNLLLYGRKKFKGSTVPPFVQQCDEGKLLPIDRTSLETIASYATKGSKASRTGFTRQKFYSTILSELDIPHVCDKKLDNAGKTWDLVIGQIAVEVSSSDSTGSNQSNKKGSMQLDINANPEYKFVFIGGGQGWKSRAKDAETISKMCDRVFSRGNQGAIEFVKYVLKNTGRKRSIKRIESALQAAKKNAKIRD